MDFLDPDNVAGRSLLELVARGSSIITELMRLSAHIPHEFLGPFSPNPADIQKYANILFDFRYLKATEAYDERIDRDTASIDLDEELRETHFTLLERFYSLFESYVKYIDDLNQWVEELQSGSFLQHTLEGVFDDPDGVQLLCEALYLYGTMLLLLDLRIPGPIRERMIIAYYRYKGGHVLQTIDEVCRLCKDTGYLHPTYPFLATTHRNTSTATTAAGNAAAGGNNDGKSTTMVSNDAISAMSDTTSPLKPHRPANYPEEYLGRITVDPEFVDLVIGKLRSDDIYFHISAFPQSQHRSIALSKQAAMLYICLYFKPDFLKKNTSVCREIVDRFFVDNYVVNVYLGITFDIISEWDPYPTMKQAMATALTRDTINHTMKTHHESMQRLTIDIQNLLTEGVLTDEFVMDNMKRIISLIRNANDTLRWMILHTNGTQSPKSIEVFRQTIAPEDILALILVTSQLEGIVKSTIDRLITTKHERWSALQQECVELLQELADVYGGVKSISRTKNNQKLMNWFLEIKKETASIQHQTGMIAGRTITQLLKALNAVQENHQVESSLQVVQCLLDVKKMLNDMLRLANLTPKILADLDVITDFTYSFKHILSYTTLVHQKIAKDPSHCLLLKSMFVKMSSVLTMPLVRILQAQSRDDESVAQFYSQELVKYVVTVLDVVPVSVFHLLDRISDLMTNRLKPVPLKIERKHLQTAAQHKERYQLARLTNNVSVFTKGVLKMSNTLLGIVQLDPQQTLSDGIRKQLVTQLTWLFNHLMTFTTGKLDDFESRLDQLGKRVNGLKQSLEFIQDYLNLYGLKIWQEELSRVVNFYIEQERNRFVKKKIVPWQSVYQSDLIPIPVYQSPPPGKGESLSMNFMGRIMNELLRLTNPQHYTYSPLRLAWIGNPYHPQSSQQHKESINLRSFALIHNGLSVFGLAGLDKLISFSIVKDLTDLFAIYNRFTINNSGMVPVEGSSRNSTSTGNNHLMSDGMSHYQFLSRLSHSLTPTTQFPMDGIKLYTTATTKMEKMLGVMLPIVLKIGQSQLLRVHFLQELKYTAKSESPVLFNALSTLNTSLMNDLVMHYQDSEHFNYPENPLMPQLTRFIDLIGSTDPLSKIYITTQQSILHCFGVSMFVMVITFLPYMTWSTELGSLTPIEKRLTIDGVPFLLGVVTWLRQVHASHTHLFLNLLGQYVRTIVSLQHAGTSNNSSPSEVSAQLSQLKKNQDKQLAQHAKLQQEYKKLPPDLRQELSSADALQYNLLPLEVVRVMMFFDLYCQYTNVSRETIDAVIPSYLFDSFVKV